MADGDGFAASGTPCRGACLVCVKHVIGCVAEGPPMLPTAARYLVVTPAEEAPEILEAAPVGEAVRRALLALSDGAAVFAGKDASGPFAGHEHVHIFSEAHGAGLHLTHLTLYAPMGFDARAVAALEALRWVRLAGGTPLSVALAAVGTPAELAGSNPRAGHCPLFLERAAWASLTPFVPTRHPKGRCDASGRIVGSPEHDLVRLLTGRGLPEPVEIEALEICRRPGRRLAWSDFETLRRRGAGRRGPGAGSGFRIVFPEPVAGPLALGYGAHFGLGLFGPVEQAGG
ncbi:MAG: type I-U CRISPR-associated protein Cas5/Cas6 [Deltaproteobacteria bacterium]|nr:MAG: type I-U CRISPR-associated protein Cas5/Cas6 [Deltaproteobacteria bacterium]